jgi:hypothetical protein
VLCATLPFHHFLLSSAAKTPKLNDRFPNLDIAVAQQWKEVKKCLPRQMSPLLPERQDVHRDQEIMHLWRVGTKLVWKLGCRSPSAYNSGRGSSH